MTVTNGIRNADAADRQAVIESMASVYHISLAEATQRYDDGDWRGFNSTHAAAKADEAADPAWGQTAYLSIPNEDVDMDKDPEVDTVPQANVPPGVTPAQLVKDDEKDKDGDGYEEMSEDQRQATSPTNRRSFIKTEKFDPDHPLKGRKARQNNDE